VKKQTFPQSKLALWRRTSFEILNSDDVAGRRAGPEPPSAWASTLQQLIGISRKPVPAPAWWTPLTAYFGALETRTDPSTYHWDGMKRLARDDAPLFAFQLTLAGWGHFQLYGQRPRQVSPGTAFIALIPSRHRYYLPPESPGWTFAWISIYHPYLQERMAKLVARTGPLVEVTPSGPLAAIALRLVRGAIKKDFRDRYEAELALFEFLVACEQSAQQARDSSGEGQRLVEAVRGRVLSSLPETLDVSALAAEYGMSRTHFSHYFRARTGQTPAYFAAEVRVHHAARMLLDTRAALKHVAADCGFANANYFCKVFRRFQHMSPASYRRALG
jgi:AraC-like DNA-binding protein